MEATFTIAPPSSAITDAAWAEQLYTPVRFTSMTCCHSSAERSSNLPPLDIPALFTSTSSDPNSSTA